MVSKATFYRAHHETHDISAMIRSQVESIFNTGLRALDSFEAVPPAENCTGLTPFLEQFSDAHLFIRTAGVMRNGALFCVPSRHAEKWGDLDTVVPAGIHTRFLYTTPMLPDRPALMMSRMGSDGTGMLILLEVRHLLELMESIQFAGYLVDVAIDNDRSLSNDYFREIDPGQLFYTHVLSSGKFPVEVTTTMVNSRLQQIRRRLWLYTFPFVLALSLIMGYAAWRLAAERYSPVKEIVRGLRRHEFYNVYQPIMDMRARRCIGVEVLVRWQHRFFGMINPDVFIPIIDKSKLSVLLTVEVLRRVREDLDRAWLPSNFYISVNIFPDDLEDASFIAAVQSVHSAMAAHQPRIALEITERQQLSEAPTVTQHMKQLRDVGVTFSIDDFGTGHSSLSYLENFSMDCLKIDRLFVSGIGTARHDAPILDAMTALASRLNINMVAEGVETVEQADYLLGRGVLYAQGYLYARPMKVEDLIAWLA